MKFVREIVFEGRCTIFGRTFWLHTRTRLDLQCNSYGKPNTSRIIHKKHKSYNRRNVGILNRGGISYITNSIANRSTGGNLKSE